MAVNQIPEPHPTEANWDDWKKFINRTIDQGAGFISLSLVNMDNNDAPLIAAGSRLEVNRGFYYVDSDEIITGEVSTGKNYIYATPADNAPSLIFTYSATTPELSAERGGWYRPGTQSRAVATFNYSRSGAYLQKTIIDSINYGRNQLYRHLLNFNIYTDRGWGGDGVPRILQGTIRLEFIDGNSTPLDQRGQILAVLNQIQQISSIGHDLILPFSSAQVNLIAPTEWAVVRFMQVGDDEDGDYITLNIVTPSRTIGDRWFIAYTQHISNIVAKVVTL